MKRDNLFLIGFDGADRYGFRIYRDHDDDLEIHETRYGFIDHLVMSVDIPGVTETILLGIVSRQLAECAPGTYTELVQQRTDERILFILSQAHRDG